MNEIIFDADILSMLGKIGRIDLLRELFSDSELFITFEVYNELLAAKEIGYDFIDPILEQDVGIMHLDPDTFKSYERMITKLKKVHSGELASILMCEKYGYVFATNDGNAKKFCDKMGVEWLDIVDILRLCLLKDILDKEGVKRMIKEIEEMDRTRITREDEIFRK